MSSALWEQHTEKGHVPDGRAPGPDADGASHPVSRRGGLRTKQEAADSQRGRGTAASASTGTHASLSLSGPPRVVSTWEGQEALPNNASALRPPRARR